MLTSVTRTLARRSVPASVRSASAIAVSFDAVSNANQTWSSTMSFASPESDFCDSSTRPVSTSTSGESWSKTLSFASPESDFCDSRSISTSYTSSSRSVSTGPTWSNTMSFASPESDFCDTSSEVTVAPLVTVTPKSWFHTSATATAPVSTWSQTLSFAAPESDFCDGSRSTFTLSQRTSPFPTSLAHVLQSPHACVVTTKSAPHRIVAVNAAWERLCGYSQRDVVHQTLSVIQGPATNQALTRATVQAALDDDETTHDMYVVNYTKEGREFTNHVTLATLRLSDDVPDVEFLVGVLEPVHESPLRFIG